MNKEILKLIEDRLLIGEKKYGSVNVVTVCRDFVKERLVTSLPNKVIGFLSLLENCQTFFLSLATYTSCKNTLINFFMY